MSAPTPSLHAVIYGFESVSQFEDSEYWREELSGCEFAAAKARICWKAMHEERHIERDEWPAIVAEQEAANEAWRKSGAERRAEETPRAERNADHSEGKT